MGKHVKEEEAQRMILELLERRGSIGATIREMEGSLPMSYARILRSLNEIRHKVNSERTEGHSYREGARFFFKSL